jgi:predicted O-methyltransferase YrrM
MLASSLRSLPRKEAPSLVPGSDPRRARHAQCFAAVPPRSAISTYLAATGNPAVIRARMGVAAALLAPRRDERSRAIARALATAASGRSGAGEREWIERIEARRAELAARETPTSAGFEPGSGDLPAWTQTCGGVYPVGGISIMFSIPHDWGLLLMRLVRELRPRSCLELGTAFGISAAFQAAALELNGAGRLTTLDAARGWGAIASEGFNGLGLERRVAFRAGQIAETLAAAAEEGAPIDFVFVDAEHQAEPTLTYFDLLLPHLSERAVVVLDDIGFPAQMRRAWKAIKQHERVSVAVGMGRVGIAVVG